jgi:hypothetical protein
MEAPGAARAARGSPSPNQSPKSSATLPKVPSHSTLQTVQEGETVQGQQQLPPPQHAMKSLGRRSQELPPPPVAKGLGRRSQELLLAGGVQAGGVPAADAPASGGLARQSISFNSTSSQLNIPSLFRVSCRPGVSSSAPPKAGAAHFDPLSQQLGKACYGLEVRAPAGLAGCMGAAGCMGGAAALAQRLHGRSWLQAGAGRGPARCSRGRSPQPAARAGRRQRCTISPG